MPEIIMDEAKVRVRLEFLHEMWAMPRTYTTKYGKTHNVKGRSIAMVVDSAVGVVYAIAEAHCSELDDFSEAVGRARAFRRLINESTKHLSGWSRQQLAKAFLRKERHA